MEIPAATRGSRHPIGLTPKRLVAAILAFGAIWIFVHFHSPSRASFPHVFHGFEANQGQFDSRILFAMPTSTGMIALTEDGPELIARDKTSRMHTWIHQGPHA